MPLRWDRLEKRKAAKAQGTVRHSLYDIPANDPIKVERRRRKREREPELAARASAFDAKLQPLGIDKARFKKLNREYKAFRLAAFDKGIICPSYNDWLRERLKPAE